MVLRDLQKPFDRIYRINRDFFAVHDLCRIEAAAGVV
jgi:hypothetical protein